MNSRIICGDAVSTLRRLPDASAQTCVTSPPYFGLRDYGVAGQIGREKDPGPFVAALVAVFREVRRVLRDDGTLWLNLGDSYSATTKGSGGHNPKQDSNTGSWQRDRKWRIPVGLKPKDLIGIPWRVAFALQADGWYLRSDIIWAKPNPMPESVIDRPTKAHEYLFLLAKSQRYYYDADAIAEISLGQTAPSWDERKQMGEGSRRGFAQNAPPGCHRVGGGATRNKRTVWTISTKPYREAHFATFPPKLIEPCILAGCPVGGVVLDPFAGACTTGLVAQQHGRKFIGIELNPAYCEMGRNRIRSAKPTARAALAMAA